MPTKRKDMAHRQQTTTHPDLADVDFGKGKTGPRVMRLTRMLRWRVEQAQAQVLV